MNQLQIQEPQPAGLRRQGKEWMQDRGNREREFYDELVARGSGARRWLDRFSAAFYDKSDAGRMWAPFWKTADLRGARVLDYGCGDGQFSMGLAGRGARVVGVDISPGLIERARARARKAGWNGASPEFMVGDAHATPFRDSSFDYVLGNGALHHLDLDRAYGEIARVLKPGGKAVFMEPMFHHPLLRVLRRLTAGIHTPDERPLDFTEMEKPRRWFRTCAHREHFLFSVCAAPAHLFGRNFALRLIGWLDRLDELAMRAVPQLRRFAWLTLLEMER